MPFTFDDDEPKKPEPPKPKPEPKIEEKPVSQAEAPKQLPIRERVSRVPVVPGLVAGDITQQDLDALVDAYITRRKKICEKYMRLAEKQNRVCQNPMVQLYVKCMKYQQTKK